MRDAFGSTFMFKLIIIFIVFYVSFMTIAVSYAKVFRIKNGVIDILEQNQYNSSIRSDWDNIVEGKVDPYLESFAYRYGDKKNLEDKCNSSYSDDNRSVKKFSQNGVCIARTDLGNNRVSYTVVVYLVIQFPLFKQDFVIPITGETTAIKTL